MGERVAVFGATGFAGAIAAALLHEHPHFELAAVTARAEAGRRLCDVHPRHRVPLTLKAPEPARIDCDAAVVAYPHGAAAPLVAELRRRGRRVVDLSADFRLRDPQVYARWYGEHGAPELLADGGAVYGLPELHRDAIAAADLVANPGCYPTAALLALAPLARQGAIADLVIDAKSGISGAGREATPATHFVAANENVTPYKVDAHRHTPEIAQELAGLGADVEPTFVPHLVPLDQGELVSCYVRPPRPVEPGDVARWYERAYADEPWVELRRSPPGVRDVRDTNRCALSVHVEERTSRIMVFAVIDNLWKGAASQAVQNLNLMYGRPEGEGLR